MRPSVCVWCCFFVLRHGYDWEGPGAAVVSALFPVQRSGFCSFTRRPVLPFAGLSGGTTSKIKLPETSLLLVSPED